MDTEEPKLNNNQLANILIYCSRLAELVAPKLAHQVGLNSFDGKICDLIKDLGVAYLNEEKFNLFEDEFYSEIFSRMKEDLDL